MPNPNPLGVTPQLAGVPEATQSGAPTLEEIQKASSGQSYFQDRRVGGASFINGVQNLAGNLSQDVTDAAPGMITMANVPIARMYDALPIPGKPWDPRLVRPGDSTRWYNMGQAVVDQYKKNYYDPAVAGRPDLIGAYAFAHPLYAGLDALPAFKPLAKMISAPVGNAIKSHPGVQRITEDILNRAKANVDGVTPPPVTQPPEPVTTPEPSQPTAGKVIKGTVYSILDKGASASQPAVSEAAQALQNVARKLETVDWANRVRQSYAKSIRHDVSQFDKDVAPAWNAIPEELKPQVQEYAEGTHPALHQGQPIPESIQRYLSRVEYYNLKMRTQDWAIDPGADFALPNYQPAALKLNGLTPKEYQALSGPERKQLLRLTRDYLNHKGIVAHYSPHVMPDEIERTLKNPTNFPGKKKEGPKGPTPQTTVVKVDNLREALTKAVEEGNHEKVKNIDKQLAAAIREHEAAEIAHQPHYLKEKMSDSRYIDKSHFLAEKTRWIQHAQYQRAYEQILNSAIEAGKHFEAMAKAAEEAAGKLASEGLIKQSEEAMANAGLEKVDGHELFHKTLGALEGSVMSPEQFAKTAQAVMPKNIFLPKQMADALNGALLMKYVGQHPIVKAYDWLVSVAKRYMLYGKLTFPEAQAFQSAFMLELVSLNGPRSALTSAISWVMAFDKRVTAAIPPSFAGDVLSIENEAKHSIYNSLEWIATRSKYSLPFLPEKLQQVLGSEAAVAKATKLRSIALTPVKLYERLVDFNAWRDQRYQQVMRTKAGIYYALLEAHSGSKFGDFLKNIFDANEAAKHVAFGLNNDVTSVKIAAEVNRTLGSAAEQADSTLLQLAKRVVPFPGWMATITKYAVMLPKNHPYKSLILANLYRLAPEQFADQEAPNYLVGGVHIKGEDPNGFRRVLKLQGANPMGSIPDEMEMLYTGLSGEGEKPLLQQVNWPIQAVYTLLTKLNPLTLKDFKDSNLVTAGDNQYKPEDVQDMRIGDQKAKEVHPLPALDAWLKPLNASAAKQIDRITAKALADAEPNEMFSIAHPSYKRLKTPPHDFKKAYDWPELLTQELLNLRPISYDPIAQAKQTQHAWEEQREALRNFSMTKNRD